MIRLMIVDDEASIGTMLEKALGRTGDIFEPLQSRRI